MEKPTHYIEVRILPLDGSLPSGGDIAFVTARIMACVHLHIVEGNEIAVNFPDMQTEPLKNECGNVIAAIGTGNIVRIFGNPMALMGFLVRPDFAQLLGGAACSVGKVPVKEVPADTSWEVISRNRAEERNTEAFAIRSTRRLRQRIETGVSNLTEEQLDARLQKLSKPKKKKHPPYVFVDSASTGKRFRLFLNREAADKKYVGSLNSYGLGVVVPAF